MTIAYRTIVWPNDFSSHAAAVLPHLQALAATHGAKVHSVFVAPDLAAYGLWWGEPLPAHVRHLHEKALDEARKRLADYCAVELAACRDVEAHVTYGDPAGEILKVVERVGADLIVIGAAGVMGEEPLGSVAEKLLRRSRIPVLVVPAR